MTREEAISVLQESKRQNEIMRDNPNTFFKVSDIVTGAKNAQKRIDALNMAISALRQQEHFREVTKKVEPLTLDELRQMDGEPVWCEIYIKGQPSFYGIVHGETVTGFISGDDKPANLAITNFGAYGLAWLAYRQKPEEDHKRGGQA